MKTAIKLFLILWIVCIFDTLNPISEINGDCLGLVSKYTQELADQGFVPAYYTNMINGHVITSTTPVNLYLKNGIEVIRFSVYNYFNPDERIYGEESANLYNMVFKIPHFCPRGE